MQSFLAPGRMPPLLLLGASDWRSCLLVHVISKARTSLALGRGHLAWLFPPFWPFASMTNWSNYRAALHAGIPRRLYINRCRSGGRGSLGLGHGKDHTTGFHWRKNNLRVPFFRNRLPRGSTKP